MHILTTSTQKCVFGRLIFPFKAYVLIAPVWLIYWAVKAPGEHTLLAGLSAYLLVAYAICIPFFCLAALIQFIANWRDSALASISFALAASVVFVILWQLANSSGI